MNITSPIVYSDLVASAKAELGRRYMNRFVLNMKDDYRMNWHHEGICEELDLFIQGKTKNLLIFAPPQTGKSLLTTRLLPAKMLGDNPDLKIGIMSYGADIAEGFNRDIQMYIDTPEYRMMYPDTLLNGTNAVTSTKTKYLRNSTIFQIVNHDGYVRTVGVDGVLTGYAVDVFIFDDLYKNRAEALSPARQKLITSVWDSVIIPRLHNRSRMLGTFTRWAKNDIGGMLLDSGEDFKVITLPALKETRTYVMWDKREEGEALWEDQHSRKRMEKIRDNKRSSVVFNAMYQQDPAVSKDLLVYSDYQTIDRLPGLFPTITGLDFGWSPDPVAGVKAEVDRKKKIIYVDKILYRTKVFEEGVAKIFREQGVDLCIGWADSEDPKAIRRIQMAGCNVMPVIKGPGSVNSGILLLQEYTIVVVETFVELIGGLIEDEKGEMEIVEGELNTYQFEAGPNGEPTSTPAKSIGKHHALDALRYLITGYTKPTM